MWEEVESCTRGFSVLSRGSLIPLCLHRTRSLAAFLSCFFFFFLSWAHIFGVCWLEIVRVNSDYKALMAPVYFDLDTYHLVNLLPASVDLCVMGSRQCIMHWCVYAFIFLSAVFLVLYVMGRYSRIRTGSYNLS